MTLVVVERIIINYDVNDHFLDWWGRVTHLVTGHWEIAATFGATLPDVARKDQRINWRSVLFIARSMRV